MPKLEINLQKIQQNANTLKNLLAGRNFSLIAVNKVTHGNPKIAKALIKGGIEYIGESRVVNIKKMRDNGVEAQYVLIQVPNLEEIPLIVEYVDFSVNSELETIKLLAKEAKKQNKIHNIILMIEMGDLREGIDPSNLFSIVEEILSLKNIRLSGIGTNMKCFRGIVPSEKNMLQLSEYAKQIELKFNLNLKFVSGGNSANFKWFTSCKNLGGVNNLRIGEALFLGRETINFDPIPNLYTDVFNLSAEIVELKKKEIKYGEKVVSNAFGESVQDVPMKIKNGRDEVTKGEIRNQALLNIGRLDIAINGIIPCEDVQILGGSSDYCILDIKDNHFVIGQTLNFKLNYEALLKAMISPYIEKIYVV